jgi:hypothetical protein
MAHWAARHLQTTVEFELSVVNVDKPPLDYAELVSRLAQFEPSETVWLTHAPTFAIKSELFPGATFVVGADTMVRIADPRYYGRNRQAGRSAWQRIADAGCRFLVFGRVCADSFLTLSDIDLPPELAGICDGVGQETFRHDVSSTDIRRGYV